MFSLFSSWSEQFMFESQWDCWQRGTTGHQSYRFFLSSVRVNKQVGLLNYQAASPQCSARMKRYHRTHSNQACSIYSFENNGRSVWFLHCQLYVNNTRLKFQNVNHIIRLGGPQHTLLHVLNHMCITPRCYLSLRCCHLSRKLLFYMHFYFVIWVFSFPVKHLFCSIVSHKWQSHKVRNMESLMQIHRHIIKATAAPWLSGQKDRCAVTRHSGPTVASNNYITTNILQLTVLGNHSY